MAWLSRLTMVAICGVTTLGCSSDPKVEYQSYTGTSYPNRAAPTPWPKAGAALVTNRYGDSVSAVDLALGMAIYTRPVGRNPVDLDGPRHVAVDAASRVAYTALSYPRVAPTGPHAAHGSASVPGYVEKLSLDDLSILGNMRVENSPGDIALSPDGKRLVVSHFDLERAKKNPTDLDKARASLAIIDPTQITFMTTQKPTLVTVCVAPQGVALEPPTGARAFVACYGEDSLAIVDLDHVDAPIERVPVAADVIGFGSPTYGPSAAVFSPDGKTIALSDTESHDVRFFDLATKTFDALVIGTVGVPFTTSWSDDGATLFVPTQQPDGLQAWPRAGGAPTSVTFDSSVCQAPATVAHSKGRLYLICEGDHTGPGTLVVLDESLTILSSAPLGVYPDALVLLPDGFQ